MREDYLSRIREDLVATTLLAVAAVFAPTPAVAEEIIGSTDFVTPDAPGTHVMTFIVGLAPGEEIKMHSHGGTGMVLVLEGEAVVTELDGTSNTYKAGDTFMENVGNVHGAVVSDAGPARVLWTIVLPDGMELETPYSG
jgi:quercetin dioxygenase-like cupin family protein